MAVAPATCEAAALVRARVTLALLTLAVVVATTSISARQTELW